MLLLLLGCAPSTTSWVAPTDDPAVTIGVTRTGEDVEAYVCGQDDAIGLSRWLGATVEDEAFTTTDDGWTLTIEGLDGVPTGVFEGPGGTFAWTGAAVEAPEGLYDAEDAGCRTGFLWAGEVAVGTWCDAYGNYEQVEPPDTIVPAEDGTIEVNVDAPDGLRTLRLSLVSARRE